MCERIARCFVFCFACCSLSAQWLNYHAPGIPRTPDGKPNLTAPAPKTREGKPDFSGIWEDVTRIPNGPKQPPFVDIGAWVKGGLPYTPEGKKLVDERSPGDSDARATEPSVLCLPQGLLYRYFHALRKFVQTPDLLLMLNEHNKSYRQIFLDGRSLSEDPDPGFDGYSVGKWEGDTLVIESNGFHDNWLDEAGNPITGAAKITERLRRQDFGHMTAEVTINDPKVYTRPWTVALPLRLEPDTELLDEFCTEGEKDRIHMVGK